MTARGSPWRHSPTATPGARHPRRPAGPSRLHSRMAGLGSGRQATPSRPPEPDRSDIADQVTCGVQGPVWWPRIPADLQTFAAVSHIASGGYRASHPAWTDPAQPGEALELRHDGRLVDALDLLVTFVLTEVGQANSLRLDGSDETLLRQVHTSVAVARHDRIRHYVIPLGPALPVQPTAARHDQVAQLRRVGTGYPSGCPILIGCSMRCGSGSEPDGANQGAWAGASGRSCHLRPTRSTPIG